MAGNQKIGTELDFSDYPKPGKLDYFHTLTAFCFAGFGSNQPEAVSFHEISFLSSLWSSCNQSLLGSRSRHCYAIKWIGEANSPVRHKTGRLTRFIIKLS